MTFLAPSIPVGTKVKIRPEAIMTQSKDRKKILLDFVYRVIDNEYHCYVLNCPVDMTFYEEDLIVLEN